MHTTFCYFVLFLMLAGCLAGCGNFTEKTSQIEEKVNIPIAEEFVSAFYSFNPERLEASLHSAQTSIPLIIYYQGWAKGGNYEIVDRKPCKLKKTNTLSCSITVKDDLMKALGIPFNVTDTFGLTFGQGAITKVQISSNDLVVYRDAEKWVRLKMPELIKEPCKGFFNGGPTPGMCVQAMVKGYGKFAASEDFPK